MTGGIGWNMASFLGGLGGAPPLFLEEAPQSTTYYKIFPPTFGDTAGYAVDSGKARNFRLKARDSFAPETTCTARRRSLSRTKISFADKACAESHNATWHVAFLVAPPVQPPRHADDTLLTRPLNTKEWNATPVVTKLRVAGG